MYLAPSLSLCAQDCEDLLRQKRCFLSLGSRQANKGTERIETNGLKLSCMKFFNFVTFPTFFHFCFIIFVTSIFFPLPFHTSQKLRREKLRGLPKVTRVGLEPTCSAPKS